jgi:hypothetical protein
MAAIGDARPDCPMHDKRKLFSDRAIGNLLAGGARVAQFGQFFISYV